MTRLFMMRDALFEKDLPLSMQDFELTIVATAYVQFRKATIEERIVVHFFCLMIIGRHFRIW